MDHASKTYLVSRFFRTTFLLAMLSLGGCATPYVDNGLKDVAKSEYTPPAAPQPVQLLFTFETKGNPNARATDFLKKDVTGVVTDSGLFSSVSPNPVAGGALLSVTLNNVPVTSENAAFAKGFATGLTLGLAGNVVTDGYVCTVEYLPPQGSTKIVKIRDHAIHTTVGAASGPPHSTKAPSLKVAVQTVTRQVVANTLKDLAADPAAGL